jgi:hypothetical protein
MSKSYPVVPDRADGDVFTEFMWDAYVAQNINNMIAKPMWLAEISDAVGVGVDVIEPIYWDVEAVDNDGILNPAANVGLSGIATTKAEIKTAGVYVVGATVQYHVWTGTDGLYWLGLRVNGETYHATRRTVDQTANVGAGELCVESAIALRAGDYVEVMAYRALSSVSFMYFNDNGQCRFYGWRAGAIPPPA